MKKIRNVLTTPAQITLPKYKKIALVLQGGGALGSYQAGVYQGLHEAGIEPHWIAGISIGALNTAIIAGNAPENRVQALNDFWNTICKPAYQSPLDMFITSLNEHMRRWWNSVEANRSIMEGQEGFFKPRFPLPLPGINDKKPNEVSFYDTSALKTTLEKYADFDRINSREMHVSLGAVNVRTGNFIYFDNMKETLLPEHFMASGALPPGFPAVEIEGEYYWDGGLMSNTPLIEVLENNKHNDSLIFQVDLWSSNGNLPTNFYDIAERTKDIQYSSRTRMVTNLMAERHKNAVLLQELLKLIPANAQKGNEWCKKAEDLAKEGVVNVIHLIYKNKMYESHYKDYEFSHATKQEHWQSGLEDIRKTFHQPHWFDLPSKEKGFVTHDIHRKSTK